MKLIEYSGSQVWARTVAQLVANQLSAGLDRNTSCGLVLAGGSTPVPIYRELAQIDIDWQRVAIVPSDERCVAADSARSNFRMISASLHGTAAAAARLISLYSHEETVSGQLDATAARVDGILPASVSILGLGEDLHTASLFPGSASLVEAMASTAPSVMAMTGPDGERRITLTRQALAQSGSIHFVIAGAAKRLALERALAQPDRLAAPAGALLGSADVHCQ